MEDALNNPMDPVFRPSLRALEQPIPRAASRETERKSAATRHTRSGILVEPHLDRLLPLYEPMTGQRSGVLGHVAEPVS